MSLTSGPILAAQAELSAGPVPKISFEFFPPKTPEMEAKLWESVVQLAPFQPEFVSVTYGAGGSTRERTHSTVKRLLAETMLKPAAHLTCVSATREEVDRVADEYWQAGVRHIEALRGDAPSDMKTYQPHPGGYAYAADLVEGLKRRHEFEISVAAYPEKHPEAQSLDADIDVLKRKVDAGAARAITQYFFDVEHYRRFADLAAARGIDVPIVPGILPVTNFAQLVKFSAACGASVPDWLAAMFTGLDENPAMRNLVAVYVAALQCRLLQKIGVSQFHFYTLNRAELAGAICHILGVRTVKNAQS